jgi:hypothetical protein
VSLNHRVLKLAQVVPAPPLEQAAQTVQLEVALLAKGHAVVVVRALALGASLRVMVHDAGRRLVARAASLPSQPARVSQIFVCHQGSSGGRAS